MPIFKQKNENFFKTWSPEMAYVLGFFAADGYMITNKRGAHFIDFYSNDLEILKKIRKIISSNHKITTRLPRENQTTSYKLQIGSKTWFADLTKLGFMQNKSLALHFPQIPRNYLNHFVRGYFDGDGCISCGRYRRKDRKSMKLQVATLFTSGSSPFLERLKNALAPFTIGGFLRKKRGAVDLVYSHRDTVALFNLMYNNVTAGMFLERKYQAFQKALQAMKFNNLRT